MDKNVEVEAGLKVNRISGEKQGMVATKRSIRQEDPWWMVDGNGSNVFQGNQPHP